MYQTTCIFESPSEDLSRELLETSDGAILGPGHQFEKRHFSENSKSFGQLYVQKRVCQKWSKTTILCHISVCKSTFTISSQISAK
jgi:hypothetical protein